MKPLTGLTTTEVLERRKRGQGNAIKLSTSRSYTDIVKSNVFNPINIVLYIIGLGMLAVSSLNNALATVGLAIFNAAVGVFQESRAKQKLDQIALLARAKVAVLRDGQEQAVDPSELVVGDILILRAGDQLPVDGVLVGDGHMEVDESQLTGETDLIAKTTGDPLLSGSFCVTGSAMVKAQKVGEESFANKLAKQARQFQLASTPLQRQVNLIMKLLILVVLFFGLLAVLALFVVEIELSAWLVITAVIVGLVPIGLLTVIILNYSLGAIRISEKGGLVQQVNAVESLSNVTVLCSDKTGTLTANRIRYNDVYPIGIEKGELLHLLASFAGSAADPNKTSQAIIDGLGADRRKVIDEVPFASARKWSALAFDDPGGAGRPALKGAYVLGALEMLKSHFEIDPVARQQLEAWSSQGLRVLVFAGNRDAASLHNAAGEPILPELTLFGVVIFSDELRPHLKETIENFTRNGIRLKIISGDNPQTVAALSRQAGLPADLKLVSGLELAQMSPAEFDEAAVTGDIFGRITPQQKEALVDALRRRGEYVAMMGDGVNDVLSIKKANMGIAMQSGSSATRSVADMVLLNDSFEALPPAFLEGQRIVNSMHSILKLFLPTVLALALMIMATAFLNLGFPLNQMQNTLVSFLVRGLPPIALAYWARPRQVKESVYKGVMHISLPAAGLMFLFGLLVYIAAYGLASRGLTRVDVTPEMIARFQNFVGATYDVSTPEAFQASVVLLIAQTALTAFYIFSGVLLMLFIEPYWRWFAEGEETSPDWRPTALAGLMIVAYIVIAGIPPLRVFFQLMPLLLQVYTGILVVTVLWVVTLRAALRNNWLEKFFEMNEPS